MLLNPKFYIKFCTFINRNYVDLNPPEYGNLNTDQHQPEFLGTVPPEYGILLKLNPDGKYNSTAGIPPEIL